VFSRLCVLGSRAIILIFWVKRRANLQDRAPFQFTTCLRHRVVLPAKAFEMWKCLSFFPGTAEVEDGMNFENL